jgi:uncharacterized RDD family membrane protein YckC
MKCPRCGYLGFEEVERCRHCGYDFPPDAPRREPDLALRRPFDRTPQVDDLDLIDAAAGARTPPVAESDLGSPLLGVRRSDAPDDLSELPLFTEHTPRVLTPRAPLSVRRPVPETPRIRSERSPLTSLDFPSTDLDVSLDAPVSPAVRARSSGSADVEMIGAESAGLGARYVAATVDVILLALADLIVVYLTVQICGLTINEVSTLPLAPLAAFLALQNGGYLVACTVGGQTIGKWLMGIRVVGVERSDILDIGRSLLRTLAWVILAVPAGLGLLTALVSDDRQGLHDRLARTRVVRAARS